MSGNHHRRPGAANSSGVALLLSIVRDMQVQAEAGDWEKVERLEARRRGILEHCFPLRGDAQTLMAAMKTLRQIIDLDAQVMSMLTEAHGESGRALRRINQGRQGSSAYKQVAGGS